jgi:hypothetical protein
VTKALEREKERGKKDFLVAVFLSALFSLDASFDLFAAATLLQPEGLACIQDRLRIFFLGVDADCSYGRADFNALSLLGHSKLGAESAQC